MKVADLLAEKASATVAWGGLTVKITHRVAWEEQFTEADWGRVKELPGREYFSEVVPRMVTDWDLQDADGEPIPVTADAIAEHEIPLRFLRLVESAVLGGVESGKGSNGSSPAG